ncbi:MAG: response regulator [Bacteroidales bacterium]|nr:response regulator [Bacteroidales bacterium]
MAKILIIDDETAIAMMLKRLVEKSGHMVEIAVNGKEGMEVFDTFNPDLLITDIVMPEKEGLEIIFDLRRKNPNLKIVAISGGGRFQYEGYLKSAKHLGADLAFQKPLDLKEFMASITGLLNEENQK